MSIRSGVFIGSCANCGMISDSRVEVIASGACPPGPSRSIDVSDVRMRPHSVWPRSSWLKPALEMLIPRPYGTPPTGVFAPKVGKLDDGAYDAVRLGAPAGGRHWPMPLPIDTVNRESEPSVMPTGSS